MRFTFGECELDTSCFELTRRGKPGKLEPKVFDVLLHLIEHRDRVVTKQELLDALWPGEAVSDSVLPRCIAAIRRAVGDSRARQRTISTIHGRGYRFIASLEIQASENPPTPPRNLERVETVTARATGPLAGGDAGAQVYVGGDRRMLRLKSALERSQAGGGGISFIVGEPGIGKSRLADELVACAHSMGFAHFVARCHEGDGAPAYWPWLQILRDAIASIENDDELRRLIGLSGPDLAELVPELRQRIGEIDRSAGPEGEQARFRLYDSVTRFLAALARRQPQLLVIDDLHWADASSLGLIRFLAGQIAAVPLLVVGTFRDVDVRRGHPLSDLLGALARDERCDRVALTGFDREEVSAFVEGIVGEAPSPDFASTIRDMTEGNPFFVREIAHLLVEDGGVSNLEATRLDTLRLPQGVRDAIGRRLDLLSSECNEALRNAAVLGRQFGLAVLSEMMDENQPGGREGLLESIAEALDAGIIVEQARGRYAFGHALTRQTLYEELRAPQRIVLHRRAGEALERAIDPSLRGEDVWPELAHHFFEAAAGGNVDKAIAYCTSAAESAHRQFAYDEAASFYERALEALALSSPVDGIRHAELLLALGEATHTAGRRSEALATLGRAAELARSHENWELAARCLIASRGFGELGSMPEPEILEIHAEALEKLRPDADRLRSQLISRFITVRAPSMRERRAMAEEAGVLARRSGDATAMRDALFVRWWSTMGPEHMDERFEVVRALRGLAEETGDIRTRLIALECEIGALFVLGDHARITRAIDEFEAIATELRQPQFIFMAMEYRTSSLINQGAYTEAEAATDRAFAYGDGVVPFAALTCFGQLYWSKSLRGAPLDANRDTSKIVELVGRARLPEATQEIFITMMRYSFDDDAKAAFEAVKSIDYRALDRDENWMLAQTSLADVALAVGDRERCEWIYEALRPFDSLVAIHDLMRMGRGSVAFMLGLLAVGLGRNDDGVAHFERAIEVESAARMRLARSLSRVGLAGALDRRDRPGDSERARELLSLAREEMNEIGVHENHRVMRLLARDDLKNPFDSRVWRHIQAS